MRLVTVCAVDTEHGFDPSPLVLELAEVPRQHDYIVLRGRLFYVNRVTICAGLAEDQGAIEVVLIDAGWLGGGSSGLAYSPDEWRAIVTRDAAFELAKRLQR